MTHISPQPPGLATLIHEQETDALDDGFQYEHIGHEAGLEWGASGWITPTPFMVVSLKELLHRLVEIYGYTGHWLMREIGRDNLRDPGFTDHIGLPMFCRLYDASVAALPDDERVRLGYSE